MRLLLVELNRFRSRRAIVLMLLAAAAITAVTAWATIWDTRPLSESEQASRTRFDDFYVRSPLSLGDELNASGLAVLFIVVAMTIIVGTTFSGGDWASGSMSNQLLFEPRRSRVWAAKAVATFLGTLLAATLILATFWLALYVTAEVREIATPPRVVEDIAWSVVRGVLLAACAAVGGFALAMLVRHTLGTLGVVFVYAIGGEAVLATLSFAGSGRWSLANNVTAWVQDGMLYYDPNLPCPPGRPFCPQGAELTLAAGATYLGVLLLLLGVVSAVSFARRDVP